MNILITNDDGISSAGIKALEKILGNSHNTYLVAPLKEKSATSMALTIFDKMRVEKFNSNHYAVDGFPVDCVNIGLHGEIFPQIDLVISGINRGVNMGYDVHYSGTVGAARHAAIHKYRSIAVSSGNKYDNYDYISEAMDVSKFIHDHYNNLTPGVIYNINFPVKYKPYPEIKTTKLGIRTYTDTYHKTSIYENISEFFLGGSELGSSITDDSDFLAYDLGYISITPISLETTAFNEIEKIKNWE
ncbi:MAG: 5'/3'-nucleotidase SurE [Spirochaetia bacterium]|nr:5'/3'-nucleotidase SurE [Spirochaetia bacterium]